MDYLSIFRFTHFIDVLTTEENNEMLYEQSLKEKVTRIVIHRKIIIVFIDIIP